MSQIDEHIWIGGAISSSNEQLLKDNLITHILCCAEEFKHPPGFLYITGESNERWYRLPIVDDAVSSETGAQFKEGAKKLNEWVTDGHTVMVHCFAGISRSVSVVIAYYMIYKGWSFEIAYSHIKQRRRQIHPHSDFIPILKNIIFLNNINE